MGNYINTGNGSMQEGRAMQIYVDKSLLVQLTNAVIGTGDKCLCVSRPRRFG
jgi:hypothetical protein